MLHRRSATLAILDCAPGNLHGRGGGSRVASEHSIALRLIALLEACANAY